MRQNFKRDKFKKEEARKKKQEEKRNRRLHKKTDEQPSDSSHEGLADGAEISAPMQSDTKERLT